MMTQSVAAAGVGVATVKLCDARAHGAKADGVTKDTKAIQAAIDDCANAGGGTVRLIGGTFLTGPILLKSNITLEIEKGAVLLGSPDRADYPMVTFARNQTVQPLVSAVNAKNVAIVGEGTIDGNGKVWWDYIIGAKEAGVLGNDHPRPMGVVFDHTKHVRMEGVTVQNSGFWQIVPYYADDVTIRKIRVRSLQLQQRGDRPCVCQHGGRQRRD
jgi:polygalacturonase